MKTKRETEGRGYREMLEIDCSTGPRHRDFIYRIQTPPTFTWYFQNAGYDGKRTKCVKTISPLNVEVFICIHQNTLHYSLLCVCMVKTNGVRFTGDAVSHSPNSLRQNGFGQAGKTTDVVLECDTPGCQIFPWQCMCWELTQHKFWQMGNSREDRTFRQKRLASEVTGH